MSDNGMGDDPPGGVRESAEKLSARGPVTSMEKLYWPGVPGGGGGPGCPPIQLHPSQTHSFEGTVTGSVTGTVTGTPSARSVKGSPGLGLMSAVIVK